MENSYLLSYTQLFILASSQGYNGAAGLPVRDSKNTVENLPSEIKGLSDLGLIEIKDDSFVCTPKAKEIGRRIGGADRFVLFLTKKKRLPDFSCYPGEPIMICVPSLVNENKASVKFLSFEELNELLTDEGYYPACDEEFEPVDKELEEYETNNFGTSDGSLEEDAITDFSAEIKNIRGESLGCVKVISYYFYRYILMFNTEGKTRIRYSSMAVEKALKGLVCRDDNC